MKRTTISSLITLVMLFAKSCIPPSTNQIEKIDVPDRTKNSDFGIEVNGEIIYQFYQKYGFTDLEEQIILIVKPDNVDYLSINLPLDSLDIKRLVKIDTRKFTNTQPIIFEPEKSMQADIRLESKEYDSGKNKSVVPNDGKYRLTQTDTTETLYLYDSQSGLMYIESKK